MVLEQGDHLVDSFDAGMTPTLALPDLVRVAAALGNYSRLELTSWTGDTETAKTESGAIGFKSECMEGAGIPY